MHSSMTVSGGNTTGPRPTMAAPTTSTSGSTATPMRRPLVTVVVGGRFRDENRDYCNYGRRDHHEDSCYSGDSASCGADRRQRPQTTTKAQQRSSADGSGVGTSLLSGVIFWRTRRNKKRSVSQSAAAAAKCLSKADGAAGGGAEVCGGGNCGSRVDGGDQHIRHKHHQHKHDGLSPTTSGGSSSGGSSSSDDEAQPVKTRLDFSFEQLMKTVKNKSDENALSPDDECLTCVTRRACIQSYPCGHKVLCEKCFVTLLQVNYSEGKYPITCVFCRSPVALFKRQESPCAVVIKKSADPPGSRNHSVFSALPSSSFKRPGYF